MKNILFLFLVFTISQSTLFTQIQLLNDEFDDSNSLAQWENITSFEGWDAEHLRVHDINSTSLDKLYMRPWTTSWYNNWRGPLLFKEVSGDFTFTTQVTVTDSTATGLPTSLYSLAGVMIREATGLTNGAIGWLPGQEDFVFLSLGYASETHPTLPVIPTPSPHLEIKTTNNSSSTLQVSGINTATNVQIRINKIGPYIICMYKEPSSSWQIRDRYFRPDLPNTMQVGFVTYTDWPKISSYTPAFANNHIINANLNPDPSSNPSLDFTPDLIAEFEFARFDSIVVPSGLVGLNLSDEMVVSDSLILDFLGYPSQPYIPNNIQYHSVDSAIDIFTDHNNNYINITGDLTLYIITAIDEFENIVATYISTAPVLTIDISELPPGLHYLNLEHSTNAELSIRRILKE